MGLLGDPAAGRYVSARPDFGSLPAHSFEDRREPYVRARVPLVGGGEDVQDAKVQRWTDTHVLVHWETPEGAYNIWVTADRVTRIRRSESSWQHVYDKYEAYGDDY